MQPTPDTTIVLTPAQIDYYARGDLSALPPGLSLADRCAILGRRQQISWSRNTRQPEPPPPGGILDAILEDDGLAIIAHGLAKPPGSP